MRAKPKPLDQQVIVNTGGAGAALMRMARRRPALTFGLAMLAGAAVAAWLNRERLGRAAGPFMEDAAARGGALRDRLIGRREPPEPITVH